MTQGYVLFIVVNREHGCRPKVVRDSPEPFTCRGTNKKPFSRNSHTGKELVF